MDFIGSHTYLISLYVNVSCKLDNIHSAELLNYDFMLLNVTLYIYSYAMGINHISKVYLSYTLYAKNAIFHNQL